MAIIGKPALIKDIAQSLGFAQTNVSDMLQALTDAIQEHTARGDVVNIPGLGRFAERVRPARTGRNPHTGETLQIAESRTLVFKGTKSRKA